MHDRIVISCQVIKIEPEYEVLNDRLIFAVYACPECGEGTDWQIGDHQHSGTPVCDDCCCDMEYVETRKYHEENQ